MTTPNLPDDLAAARDKARAIAREYQQNRIEWYSHKVKFSNLLKKDIAMFGLRGAASATEYLEEAFRAAESSSEETVMGHTWQRMLSAISEQTLDTGDLTTVRDDTLWVCELKAQTNTTNSSSFPQELRALRTRMEELTSRHRASKQPVKAAYCVLRDSRFSGNGIDESRVFQSGDVARENRDLDGFEYRYITGKSFWQWLTGYDSEIVLLMPLSDFAVESQEVRSAREHALTSLTAELLGLLRQHGLSNTLDDLVKLRDELL